MLVNVSLYLFVLPPAVDIGNMAACEVLIVKIVKVGKMNLMNTPRF